MYKLCLVVVSLVFIIGCTAEEDINPVKSNGVNTQHVASLSLAPEEEMGDVLTISRPYAGENFYTTKYNKSLEKWVCDVPVAATLTTSYGNHASLTVSISGSNGWASTSPMATANLQTEFTLSPGSYNATFSGTIWKKGNGGTNDWNFWYNVGPTNRHFNVIERIPELTATISGPDAVTQPAPINGYPTGAAATYRCAVTGAVPNVVYSWYVFTEGDTDWAYKGTSSSLTLTFGFGDDIPKYNVKCLVMDYLYRWSWSNIIYVNGGAPILHPGGILQ